MRPLLKATISAGCRFLEQLSGKKKPLDRA
jgi:hypothetical protein